MNNGHRQVVVDKYGLRNVHLYEEGVPWIHMDIAGTASLKSESELAPAGATGWGVRAINQLIADHYEG